MILYGTLGSYENGGPSSKAGLDGTNSGCSDQVELDPQMIERALELWPAFDQLLTFDPYRAFQRAQLTLNSSAWIVLAKLGDILHIFFFGTKFASGSTYPMLTMQ